jgi:hypothetical protein
MDWLPHVASWVQTLDIRHAFWLYSGLLVLHELEEWNIARFEKRVFTGLPAVHSDRNARAWIAVISLFVLGWCAIASLPARTNVAVAIFLPAIFMAATNALQHIVWSMRFRTPAPMA